ncbi:MAG: TonB-dependent receptor, partial [Ferruginibacter sp.]
TIGEKPDIFYYNNITPSDFVDVESYLFGKGYYTPLISATTRPPLSPVVEILLKKASGALSPQQADLQINELRNYDLRQEFNRYIYKKSINRQHAVNLRGGSNIIAYSFSAGFDHNNSTLDDEYKRLTVRSENTFAISSRFQMTTGVTFTHNRNDLGLVDYNSLSTANGRVPIYTRLADNEGNPLPVIRQFRQAYLDTAGAGKLLNWNYYPLEDYKHVDNRALSNSLIGNFGASLKISKNITGDIKYQYERQDGNNTTKYDADSYMARDLINYFSQLNRTTGVVTYRVPKGGIISKSMTLLQAHNFRNQVNFNKSWGRHTLYAIAGNEVRDIKTTGNSYRVYGYRNEILTVSNTDFANSYPNFVSNGNSFIPNEISFNEKTNRFVTLYSNAAYTLNSKYTLSASGRRDAANLFGVRTNQQWTPLWSTGLSWDVTRERFWKLRKMPYLKLRATYGVSGNADPSRSGYTIIAYGLNSIYTQQPTARIDQFTNPELRWEKIAMMNAGMDFRFFGNRMTGSIEYYTKRAKDLLGFAPVDYTNVPTNRLTKNVASMKGSGWDMALNTINLKGPLTWMSHLNLNVNRDKVTDYFLSTRSATNYLNGGLAVSAIVGKPVYGVYAYRWAGLDSLTGDPRGYINGQISKDYNAFSSSMYPVDSLRYIGRGLPKFFGSLGNQLTWKSITLSFQMAFKAGYYFQRNSLSYINLFSSRQGHGDYALRWQKPGDEKDTNVPSMVYPANSLRDQFYNFSDVLVERGDHVRLQYINLSYTVVNRNTKLPFNNLQFYSNLNNVGILWRANKYGIDPDYRDNTILPPRNIAFGIRANFK